MSSIFYIFEQKTPTDGVGGKAADNIRPYGLYRGLVGMVGAFCERPRANAVRPYRPYQGKDGVL